MLVTNDAECRRRGLAEGLRCLTAHDYVAAHCPALRDVLAAAPSAAADGDDEATAGGGAAGQRGGGAAYAEHATPAELQAGLREGRFRQVPYPSPPPQNKGPLAPSAPPPPSPCATCGYGVVCGLGRQSGGAQIPWGRERPALLCTDASGGLVAA